MNLAFCNDVGLGYDTIAIVITLVITLGALRYHTRGRSIKSSRITSRPTCPDLAMDITLFY